VLAGAFAQVAATALMLAAMGGRSFVVTIAYTKNRTDPGRDLRFDLSLRQSDFADDGRDHRSPPPGS
jgi:hypothetical protein